MQHIPTFPIAQLFTSPQGEGMYTGALMRFVRLAGCNVGEYVTDPRREMFPLMSICTNVHGESFLCDTDYHKYLQLTAQQAITQSKEKFLHVCLTGGEPFLHNVNPFVEYCRLNNLSLHIETSGTKVIPPAISDEVWITCSPKKGFLPSNVPYVNEFKFVLSGKQPIAEVLDVIYRTVGGISALDRTRVFVQPINGTTAVDQESLAAAIGVQRADPRIRLSPQMHKLIGVD